MRGRRFAQTVVVVLALLGALVVAAPASAAPANDNIVAAQALPAALPSSTPATTIGATGEAGESVFSPTNQATESVWFSWTPAAGATAVVDLCAAGFTGPSGLVGIGVYTGGTTFASLTEVDSTAGECKLAFNATAAVTYKIQVDYLHVQGDFTLTMRAFNPPANDAFATPQALAGPLPISVPATNVDSTAELGEPVGLGNASARSVWFSWTSPLTGHVQLNGCPFETLPGYARNKTLGVYTGATLGTLAEVVRTNNCTVEFNATSGVTYRIAFSGNSRGEGSFVIGLRDAPPPANDDFAAAQPLAPILPLAVAGDNSFATVEPGENLVPIGGITGPTHTVWYRWTPAIGERVKLNACGSDGRPRLGVFTGASIATLKVANEPPGFAPYCAIELDAIAGTTYSIAIAGSNFENSTGPFQLELHTVQRPGNDNFVDATPIGPDVPIAVDGSTVDATIETKEVGPSLERNPIATVWYRWESSISAPVVISTCGSATDVVAGVHTGTDVTTLALVAPSGEEEAGLCPDPDQNGGQDTFTAVAGTVYWIQVSGLRRGLEGPFHLTIVDPNAKPKPQPTGGDSPGATAAAPAADEWTLQEAIARCREKFGTKSAKSRAKRAACVARAKLKFAILDCRAGKQGAQRRKCVAAAHRRFQPADRPRHRH